MKMKMKVDNSDRAKTVIFEYMSMQGFLSNQRYDAKRVYEYLLRTFEKPALSSADDDLPPEYDDDFLASEEGQILETSRRVVGMLEWLLETFEKNDID